MTSAQQAVDVASDKCQQAIDVKSKAQTAANDATENAQENSKRWLRQLRC